jgi:DNA invertase Pin-like site-specific DNA recombinase
VNYLKAAIYLRRSTDKQEYSLGDQEKPILEFAHKYDHEIVERFVDDAVSGRSVNGRDEFKRMIELGTQKNPPFELILVYDVSRFSRTHPDEAAHYEFVLRENGVRVIYVAEPFSGDDSIGDMLMKPMKRTLAHMFSLEQAQKVLRGSKTNAARGYSNGGSGAYAYDRLLVDHAGQPIRVLKPGERKHEKTERVTLVPTDDNRPGVVSRIFHLFAEEKLGRRAIANVLNAEGIPSPTGGKWFASTIGHILRNPVYKGARVYNRKSRRAKVITDKPETERIVKENAHPAIVPAGLFDKAQQRIGTGSERKGKGRPRPESPYLLGSMIECEHCGRKFFGHLKRNADGRVYRYYIDSGYHMGGSSICYNFQIPKEEIEGFAISQLKRKLQNGWKEKIGDELWELVCQESANSSKVELKTLGRRIKANDEAIHNLTKAVEMGFDATLAMQRLGALKAERVELEDLKDKLTRKVADTIDPDAIVEGALGLLDEFEDVMASAPLPKQKAIIRCFVAGARANPKERRVEVAFYQVPFPRDMQSCVPYVAMPEVRVEPTRSGRESVGRLRCVSSLAVAGSPCYNDFAGGS